MCGADDPANVADALTMLDRALTRLAAADAGSLPTDAQAQALRALERAEARHTAARAQILAAFAAQDGYEDDGHGSARVWLAWQTRVTKAAAVAAVGWSRRLAAHPVIARALADGELSVSWARAICGWSDRLPDDKRDDADAILTAAAAGGAELADLAGLAEQMYQRSRTDPDDGPDDGFDDRRLWLDLTFAGAGRLTGDLTPGCAAALSAVLDALGKRAGPEDLRTATQRRHDALEEACRRLIAAGMLPGRAGQPTQAQVHITLSQLRSLPGASEAEAAWRAAAAATSHGWLVGPDADAAGCDATLAPIVTGHVDEAALGRLVEMFLTGHAITSGRDGRPGGCRCGGCTCPARIPAFAPDAEPVARLAAGDGRRRVIGPGRPGLLAAAIATRRRPRRYRQPAAGCPSPARHRPGRASHPGPSAPRRHRPPPVLRVPRLRPARQLSARSTICSPAQTAAPPRCTIWCPSVPSIT